MNHKQIQTKYRWEELSYREQIFIINYRKASKEQKRALQLMAEAFAFQNHTEQMEQAA